MKYGATFSHRAVKHLGLDVFHAFDDALKMKFEFLRLSVYWDETQPSADSIHLDEIIQLLEKAQQQEQKVVLIIGMKSPRWPEFYLPSWVEQDPYNTQTQEAFLNFFHNILPRLTTYSCISHWQIENEVLDPSGPKHWTVPLEFLRKEVALLRQQDSRPIILTAWGNELSKRKLLPQLAELADVVGIDIYGHQHTHSPLLGTRYIGPKDTEQQFCELFDLCQKPVWITELQAEPWEKSEAEYKSDQPESISVKILEEHLEHAKRLQVETVFFWGIEYWLWREKNGDSRYIEFWQKLRLSERS